MRKLSGALLTLIFLFICVSSARSGILDVSEGKEVRIGEEAAQTLLDYYGLVKNQAEVERLEGITDNLIQACGRPELEYHFYIIDTDFVNAFALPGGYIFVTRGLMDFVENDDELASVVGHELVHVAHKHGVVMYKKSIRNMVMNFIVLAVTRDPKAVMASQMYQQSRMDIFGRTAEVEADTFSIHYLQKAGYSVYGSLHFMDKMERESKHYPNLIEDYFEFHPPMDERKDIILAEYEKMGLPAPPDRGNDVKGRVIVLEKCDDKAICTAELTGDKQQIMVIGDSGNMNSPYERGRAVAVSLNALLANGIRMYELKKQQTGDSWEIYARNIMVIRILDGDVVANNAATGEELADIWLSNIKKFLWNDFIKEDI